MAIIFHLPHTYMSRRGATINITVPSDVANGTVVTCTCGSSTLSATVGSSKQVSFKVFMGTWNVSCGILSRTLIVDAMIIYDINLSQIFAYRINVDDPNPSTRVTYPETINIDGVDYAVTNYGYNPIRNIDGSGVTYGSWTGNEFFFPKPCMLTYAGEVDYYLDPNDYTKKLDGSASDVADINYGGNAMVQFPKAWVRRQIVEIDGTNYEEFVLSGTKLSNDFHAYAHKDSVDGTLRDYMYQGIYACCTDNFNRMRSISGQTITTNLQGASANADLYATGVSNSEIGRAINNNIAGNITPGRWFSRTWAQWCYLQDLTFLLAKSTNGQGTIGNGNCGGSAKTICGETNAFGLFGGDVTTNNTQVKCLGIEEMWGNYNKWAIGRSLISGKNVIKMCVDGEDGSIPGVYVYAGTGGVDTGQGRMNSNNTLQYPKTFAFGEQGRYGTTSGGSASTYCCDGVYYGPSTNTQAVVGGRYDHGSGDGPTHCYLGNALNSASIMFAFALSFV